MYEQFLTDNNFEEMSHVWSKYYPEFIINLEKETNHWYVIRESAVLSDFETVKEIINNHSLSKCSTPTNEPMINGVKDPQYIEYSVNVVKHLYDNFVEYKKRGDEFKANFMLKKLLEEGQYMSEWAKQLLEKQ